MSLSDPIGDMLARIKNAQARNHSKVSLPSSKEAAPSNANSPTLLVWTKLAIFSAFLIF